MVAIPDNLTQLLLSRSTAGRRPLEASIKVRILGEQLLGKSLQGGRFMSAVPATIWQTF
jgi:hypothetical protein